MYMYMYRRQVRYLVRYCGGGGGPKRYVSYHISFRIVSYSIVPNTFSIPQRDTAGSTYTTSVSRMVVYHHDSVNDSEG